LPAQSIVANEQQSPRFGSTHRERSSQQTLPQAAVCGQHVPFTQSSIPAGQQTPLQTVWVGGQHTMPPLHTSPFLQQTPLQTVWVGGQHTLFWHTSPGLQQFPLQIFSVFAQHTPVFGSAHCSLPKQQNEPPHWTGQQGLPTAWQSLKQPIIANTQPANPAAKQAP
jgi:hypothetical protein